MKRPGLIGAGAALATLALMLATEPSLAIAWDEGYTLGRQERVRSWLKALADPPAFARTFRPEVPELVQPDIPPRRPPDFSAMTTRGALFSPEAMAWFWPFARAEPHGHPPFYAIVGLIGDYVTPARDVLARARLGPILAFSLAAGALVAFMARRFGAWGALAAWLAWALQPRLFAEGHYATYDGILTSLWVGATLAFASAARIGEEPAPGARPRWPMAVLYGVLLGWAMDTKLTGWLLPLPSLAWALVARDRRAWRAWLLGAAIAPAVALAFNPAWWNDPIGGVLRFFESNTTRSATINISTMFLGTTYSTPRESLPWYNTLAWTLFVAPAGLLLLAVVGAASGVRRPRSLAVLVALHWAFLLALRAMPHTPGHDGVRQFLPAFGAMAVLAGLGGAAVASRWGRWGGGLILAAGAEAAIGLALIMPVPLSYYSPLVGGLPGAARLGMEPTYYWDSLTPEALAWINANTGPGERITFSTGPTTLFYLKRAGKLVPGLDPFDPGTTRWMVVQNRPGELESARPGTRLAAIRDLLVRRETPAFVVSKLGVPLLWIYPIPPGWPGPPAGPGG